MAFSASFGADGVAWDKVSKVNPTLKYQSGECAA